MDKRPILTRSRGRARRDAAGRRVRAIWLHLSVRHEFVQNWQALERVIRRARVNSERTDVFVDRAIADAVIAHLIRHGGRCPHG